MGRHMEARVRMMSSQMGSAGSSRSRKILNARDLWTYCLFFRWSLRKDPIFARAVLVSLPPALLSALLEAMSNYKLDAGFFDQLGLLVNAEVYGVVTTLLGFLIVFRNAQAYGRFWEGCSAIYQIQGLVFDAASSLIAFCSNRQEKRKEVAAFRHTLIRLLSMLNSLMLAELENATDGTDTEVRMPILDLGGLNSECLEALEHHACKVEIIFQWIQQLAVSQLRTGVVDVPAPIATRAFQELGAGVLQFHEALKIAQVPFPSTYMTAMVVLLGVHMTLSPICMVALVDASGWAFLLTFISVFTLWGLAFLGMELDNPFGHASNSPIDFRALQTEQNERLVSLVVAAQCRVPTVVKGAKGIDNLCREAREDRRRPPPPMRADSFNRRGVSLRPLIHQSKQPLAPFSPTNSDDLSVDSEIEQRGREICEPPLVSTVRQSSAPADRTEGSESIGAMSTSKGVSQSLEATVAMGSPPMRATGGYTDYEHNRLRPSADHPDNALDADALSNYEALDSIASGEQAPVFYSSQGDRKRPSGPRWANCESSKGNGERLRSQSPDSNKSADCVQKLVNGEPQPCCGKGNGIGEPLAPHVRPSGAWTLNV